ncbi:MAG: DUF2283 domain-containing protein [bacterium]|nr:DUF2283 domain-containing protein [bacterium]
MAGNVGIRAFYDSEADILEMVKDPSQVYVSRELEHGVFVHIDPKTKEVVGFAIHHFSQNFSQKPSPLPLSATFQLLSATRKDFSLMK